MNRAELIAEVKNWLLSENYLFIPGDEEAFRVPVTAENTHLLLRLQCEDEPPLLQVICPLPVRLPPEALAAAASVLHNLNACLRIGFFQLHYDNRAVTFRLTMPIRPEPELPLQFAQAFGTTINTMDEHMAMLGLLACNTPAAWEELAKWSSTPPKAPLSSLSPVNRLNSN